MYAISGYAARLTGTGATDPHSRLSETQRFAGCPLWIARNQSFPNVALQKYHGITMYEDTTYDITLS